MTNNSLWKVVPAVLTVALAACQDSITGIPEPVPEAAISVEGAPAFTTHSSSLISWWSGDGVYTDVEPNGTPNPIMLNSDVNGTRIAPPDDPNGTVTLTAECTPQAFVFTGVVGGSNQFLEIANRPDLNPLNFTVDLWAQRRGQGQGIFNNAGALNPFGNMLVQKAFSNAPTFKAPGMSYFISWREDSLGKGHIVADVAIGNSLPPSPSLVMSDPVANDVWVHVALTFDGTTAKLYVNGKEEASDTRSGGPAYGNGSMVIGNNWRWARETLDYEGPFKRTFNGLIDEVRLFNVAFTDMSDIYDPGDHAECVSGDPPPPNQRPVVTRIENDEIDEGDTFETTVSFTDDSSAPWSVTVTYGDGASDVFDVTESPFGISHTYFKDGEYTVEVTVMDDDGESDSSSARVVVSNVTPVIDDGPDDRTVFLSENGTYFSTVSFTDPGDDSWTVTVDYGDGSDVKPFSVSATSFDLSHPYTSDQCGPFAVTVTVTDDDLAEDSGAAQVTVTYPYELSVEEATVRLDRRHRYRSDRDRYDVDGRIPLSVLNCFNPETDVVTVKFAGVSQVIDPGLFVRRDEKWYFRTGWRTSGIQRFDLRDNGRFKIRARYLNLTGAHFPGPMDLTLTISIGPASGDTVVPLDRYGYLRKRRAKRFWWRWRWRW